MFEFREEHLVRLFEQNSIEVPLKGMVFFGLRGCLPIDLDDYSFSNKHLLQVTNLNYINPRCTLGQWVPGKGIAVFPGSTVPSQAFVSKARARNGVGANQLLTGFYNDYRKGVHHAGSKSGHEAFRQVNKLPIRRTTDDLDFDVNDRVEFMCPFDNLHSAWSMGVSDGYSSAGCQVVVGYPKCKSRKNLPSTGAWKVFQANAYALEQNSFPYLLLEGRDAQKVALNESKSLTMRLRYGSKGEVVLKLQEKLREKKFYEGNLDKDFGPRTLMAVLNFQATNFGLEGSDGIVGPNTADALNLTLPSIKLHEPALELISEPTAHIFSELHNPVQ
ncbi:peptidoglycan-binding domain-containing protein [Rufibacter latericius]|nr:peptidoglycan-binding protein [Rufibacter latericius]